MSSTTPPPPSILSNAPANVHLPVLFSLSLCLSLLSFACVWFDDDYSLRWVSFALYVASLLPVLCHPALLQRVPAPTLPSYAFVVLFLIAACSRLIALQEYPWVAVWDEVRDGGLDARRIALGQRLDIHGYGAYESHGLIIPTLTTVFYRLFGDSVLTYRLPAALAGLFDIVLLFYVVRRLFGRAAAFWSALTLTALHLHLYHSRTEIVVVLSSFLTTVILCGLLRAGDLPGLWRYAYAGVLAGAAAGFHASSRAVACLALLLVCGDIFRRFWRARSSRGALAAAAVTAAAFLVGFGPRLLATPAAVFFQSRSLLPPVTDVIGRYFRSLGVYVLSPHLPFHYSVAQPLLPWPLALCFILGAGLCFSPRRIRRCTPLVFLAIALPFTNSTLTNFVNADHRLGPLLPVAAAITGLGIWRMLLALRSVPMLARATAACLFIYLCCHTAEFFWQRKADNGRNRNLANYMSMHFIRLVRGLSDERLPAGLCLTVSESNQNFLNMLHLREQRDYFLPGTAVTVEADEDLGDNVYVLTPECGQEPQEYALHQVQCGVRRQLACPLDFSGNMSFVFDRRLSSGDTNPDGWQRSPAL